ncbi:pantetheine-phosphate adenylyltransferase [candidate division KSB1 bacterium]|nr:pantetheine-phosphate adenylyltransferase [candidate division KSB1 bacterium]
MKQNNKKIAIYPGSFDPITNGHIDIIKRASLLFDHVIVAVANNEQKRPLFSENERVEMITESIREIPHTTVDSFKGLLVDYARQNNAIAVIRGLRAVSDFEYELQMALVNRKLDEQLITVFLMPHESYSYLNSSIVKELALLNGNIDCFVPEYVKTRLKNKMRKK